MKLETEVDNSLCLFSSAERQNAAGIAGGASIGCSVRSRDRTTSAHASSSSIAAAASAGTQHEPAVSGRGTGAGDEAAAQDVNGFHAEHNNILNLKKTSVAGSDGPLDIVVLTSLNCEHFKFIDDDDESGDDDVTIATAAADIRKPCNGIPSEINGAVIDGPEIASNGDCNPRNRHLDGSDQVEVSVHNNASLNVSDTNDVASPPLDMSNSTGGSEVKSARNNSKGLRSVLKKGKSTEKNGKKARVTFDEAVALYSDEFDGVQLLALRSAAEVNYAEVFYMFEPPIEYQDLLPFEPPDEYRDPDTVDEDDSKTNTQTSESPDTDYPSTVPPEEEIQPENSVSNTVEENIDSTSDAPADGGDVTNEHEKGEEEQEEVVECVGEAEVSDIQPVDHKEESEKVFERFLEAEREFAEDEELNRVFHVLENDLVNDDKGDTFDDNFFKKLIGLLSAVEGDVRMPQSDFFTTTDFTVNEDDLGRDTEEDDNCQTHSRTISEADSDCSVSSQDTIIVRLVDEDTELQQQQQQQQRILCRQNSESDPSVEEVGLSDTRAAECHQESSEPPAETYEDVFNDVVQTPSSENGSFDEQQSQTKEPCGKCQTQKSEPSSNSDEPTVQSTPKDTVQDADDSTSSDSRSGEVEEDIRLDDIGYDEEDADDYDEECLRGMVRGNSKIRRIIKKNALQCTLFRGIEARRRQQSGIKYQRPKSPPLSQESLVEQLKWLTTIDESKDIDNAPVFCPKPPDVILSTGSVPLNGNLNRCASAESEYGARSAQSYRLPVHYPAQPRHLLASDSTGTYLVPQGSYPVPHPSGPARPWLNPVGQHAQAPLQRPAYPTNRAIVHPMPPQMPHPEERLAASSPVPRDYRDWRVVQRVMVNRDNGGYGPQTAAPTNFRRCPNGPGNAYLTALPPPDIANRNEELEQFVMQGSQRIERIKKRYSVAEDEEDDPTFGFARRPSVRGLQNRLPPAGTQYHPSELLSSDVESRHIPAYATTDNVGQSRIAVRPRTVQERDHLAWNRNPNWRAGDQTQGSVYCASGMVTSRSQAPMPVHRASVALSELPGCSTLPHPKHHSDPRYHSYAENMYSASQTLPHKRWPTMDPRTCVISANPSVAPHPMQHQMARLPGPGLAESALQVIPPHPLTTVASDERGVPEGASSSPKVSSDSLYHGPLPDVMPIGSTHKDDGVIYYSMNV